MSLICNTETTNSNGGLLSGREETLPKWVQFTLMNLRRDIQHLQSLKTMSLYLDGVDRDWFTLPNPIGGSNQDNLHLWILKADHPMPICTLGKGDMLFVGRVQK